MPGWLVKLRELHDEAFEFDWESHLAALNSRLRLTGQGELCSSVAGHPPVWFNGDVEMIVPGCWTLVISLNHQKGPPEGYPGPFSPQQYWDFWRRHNVVYGWLPFLSPLIHVVAPAMGDAVPEAAGEQRLYATDRMVFVELCPYASSRFTVAWRDVLLLSRTDPGFMRAAEVFKLLIEGAEPGLIIAHGNPCVWIMDDVHRHHLMWSEVEYVSAAREGKRLHHKQGLIRLNGGNTLPIIGLPFLGRARSHNGYAEYAQLGGMLRAFCESLSKRR